MNWDEICRQGPPRGSLKFSSDLNKFQRCHIHKFIQPELRMVPFSASRNFLPGTEAFVKMPGFVKGLFLETRQDGLDSPRFYKIPENSKPAFQS